MYLNARVPFGFLLLFELALTSGVQAASTVQWKHMALAISPSPRSGSAMAYDGATNQIVLFGGYGGSGYLGDTWTFDGTKWTRERTLVAPPGRTASTMAYDTEIGKLVLFGGYNRLGYLGDTWLWNGSTRTWEPGAPNKSMPAVTGPMSFTDPINGHVDVFGGFDGNLYQLKTWQWTGSAWQELYPATNATARAFSVAALDEFNHNVVLFAGLGDVNPWNTWTWSGSDWTEQSPSLQPVLRYSAGGAYDPQLQGVVIFGGGSGGVDRNDTWIWNGTSWKRVYPAKSPSPREAFGMVYDQATHHILIFGGQNSSQLMNDTWELMVE